MQVAQPVFSPSSSSVSPINPLHFVVIGNPIAHSKSPDIHQAFAKQVGLDICYARQFCPDDKESFTAVVESFFNGGGVGANVTVPFKQMAYQLCVDECIDEYMSEEKSSNRLTPHAQLAGAVNTLYIQDGQIHGHNTDGMGLVNHLQRLGWELMGKKVAIIGAGGASRGVILPLLSAGVKQIHIANRTLSKAEKLIADCQAQAGNLPTEMAELFKEDTLSCGSIEELTRHYDVIINATSIGLSGDKLPLSAELSADCAYDMMYGRELPFLQYFQAKGAKTSDGYGMLLGQAVLSFELWTGTVVDVERL